MTSEAKYFGTFVHPETEKAYLFAFEDYMSDRELEDLWEDARRIYQDEPGSEVASLPNESINRVVREVGLKRPEPGSALMQHINDIIYPVQSNKEEIVRELGFDPGEDILSLLKSA
jgi:hypothetical protein